MTRRSDLSPEQLALREELQIGAIIRYATFHASCWQMHRERGSDGSFAPALFRMPGVELPIVPRVALPRIEGAARRQSRR